MARVPPRALERAGASERSLRSFNFINFTVNPPILELTRKSPTRALTRVCVYVCVRER